jgi:ATP-dependent 26S proteasome regulatory subunit
MTYTSKGNKWDFPVIRRPTTFPEEKMTPEMAKTMDDIDKFHNHEEEYRSRGIPYRRGYMLYGKTGTGKTTIIELTAKKYNKTLYSLNFNSKELDDTIIINLIASVPPNSIVVMDEIDKQIAALNKNKNKLISIGGILSAIDGPLRLSHCTMVIMTANTGNFLQNVDEANAMFRKGRIDRQIEFKTKLDLNLDFYDKNDPINNNSPEADADKN